MRIGQAIKQLREQKSYNQKELAQACEISAAYLSQIENNKRQPSLDLIEVIGNKLGVPVPVILFRSLNEQDIQEDKREIYKILNPTIMKFIDEIFLLPNN